MYRNIILSAISISSILLVILCGGQVFAQSGIGQADRSQRATETGAEPPNLHEKDVEELRGNAIIGGEGKSQDIPFKTSSDISFLSIVQILVSLMFVLFVAYSIIWLLKKYNTGWMMGKNQQESKLTIIEVKRLTPKLSVFLIGVGDETVLLAQSGDSVSFYKGSLQIIKPAEKSDPKNN